MSDRGLLGELGRIARDDDRVAADPRWEQRAQGRLDAEGEAALRKAAAASRVGPAMLRATEPLGDRELDGIAHSVLREMGPPRDVAAQAPPAPGVVVPLRRGRRIAGAVASALAAAAVVALFLRTPALSPVPDFDLRVSPGDSHERSAPADGSAPPRFGPDSHVELILTPHAPVPGKVEVRGALVRGDEVRAFDPKVEIDPSGAARIEGTRASVFPGVPDGPWEIWLAIGRPEALPERLPPGPLDDPDAVRILRVPVLLTPAPR
jgi:hypothetical protein